MCLLKICILSLLVQLEVKSEPSDLFRITLNATVPQNNVTNQSLVDVIYLADDGNVNANKLACLLRCRSQPNCDLVVYDLHERTCRSYKKTASICIESTNQSTTIVYDNFINGLRTCCIGSGLIFDDVTYNCYSSNYNLNLNWTNSYNYCANQGLSMPILNNDYLFGLYSNLSIRTGRSFWVDSTTTIPRVFTWPDGTPIKTSYWRPGEPDNWLGNDTYVAEGCVQMVGGGLNDYICSSGQNPFCINADDYTAY